MKRVFYCEWAYVLGLVLVAFATAFTKQADLGLSMVVAPAYILHLLLSQTFEFVTFGTATYLFQGLLLIVTCLVIGKFKVSYLFSFVTAVLYGIMLDGAVALVSFIPAESLIVRIVLFLVGIGICSLGISFMFHTYIKPEVYELFVKEVSARFSLNINRVKIVYDITSCLLATAVSLIAFGALYAVNLGTVFCALVNGVSIAAFSKLLDRCFEFKTRLPRLEIIMNK